MSQKEQWYWCLEHEKVVDAGDPCPPDRKMGPYGSREEAANWQGKVEARNDKWDAEDRQWEGDD